MILLRRSAMVVLVFAFLLLWVNPAVALVSDLQLYPSEDIAYYPSYESFAANTGTYTITASAGTGGSISPSGSVAVTPGTNRSFAITPSFGYHIADILVDGTSVGARAIYTFDAVSANHTISASFAAIEGIYTIIASAGFGGSISPLGWVAVTQGADRIFGITPWSGYHLVDVLVDGTSVGARTIYIFNAVSANHTISASFAANAGTYTITASAGTGGSIYPSGSVAVAPGTNRSFIINPTHGYHVVTVLVDGTPVGPWRSYDFNAVSANHTISATFAADKAVDFTDVSATDPHREAILAIAARGVISGYTDGTFRPSNPVLRAQSAKMIDVTLGIPVTEATPHRFKDLGPDLPASLYPHEYVGAAVAKGIILGYSDNTFRPFTDVTRAQVISMVVRAARNLRPGLLGAPTTYVSALGRFDTTHSPNMDWAECNGLLSGIQGYGATWNPWASMTRGEVAQVLHNLQVQVGLPPADLQQE